MPTSINHALELSIVNYLEGQNTVSGSLLSGSNINYYAGYSNQELEIPSGSAGLCIVSVERREPIGGFPNTLNYHFDTHVYVMEMAGDVEASNLGVAAEAVLNEFYDGPSASQNFTNTGNYNMSVYACWFVDEAQEFSGDALITHGQFQIAGAMTIPQ